MINSSALISVILPVFNTEKYLTESIESVLIQTYQNWELLIIDDGSTDSSPDIIRWFLNADNRIRSFKQANGKQGKARNLGIDNSKGKFVAFIDADDLWFPDFLQQQIQFIQLSRADMVFGKAVTDNYRKVAVGKEKGLVLKGKDGIKILLRGNLISINTVLIKRECLLHVGKFALSNELQFGEDYDLWLRVLLAGYSCFENPVYLAFYRSHPEQSTKIVNSKYLQIVKIISSISDKDIENEKRKALYLWLRRALRYQKHDDKIKRIAEILNYMPSFSIRWLFKIIYKTLPYKIAKRMIIFISLHA